MLFPAWAIRLAFCGAVNLLVTLCADMFLLLHFFLTLRTLLINFLILFIDR